MVFLFQKEDLSIPAMVMRGRRSHRRGEQGGDVQVIMMSEIVFKHYITLYNFQWGRLKYNISGTKLED